MNETFFQYSLQIYASCIVEHISTDGVKEEASYAGSVSNEFSQMVRLATIATMHIFNDITSKGYVDSVGLQIQRTPANVFFAHIHKKKKKRKKHQRILQKREQSIMATEK